MLGGATALRATEASALGRQNAVGRSRDGWNYHRVRFAGAASVSHRIPAFFCIHHFCGGCEQRICSLHCKQNKPQRLIMNQQIIVRTKRSTDEVEGVYFGDEDMLQEERSSTDKSLQVDLMEIDLSAKPHSSSSTYHEVLQALLKLDRVNDGYAVEDLMAELIKQGMEVSGRLEKKRAIK